MKILMVSDYYVETPQDKHIMRLFKKWGIQAKVVYYQDLVLQFDKLPKLFSISGEDLTDAEYIITLSEVSDNVQQVMEKLYDMGYNTLDNPYEYRQFSKIFSRASIARKLGYNIPKMYAFSRIDELARIVDYVGFPAKLSVGGRSIEINSTLDVFTLSKLSSDMVGRNIEMVVTETLDIPSEDIFTCNFVDGEPVSTVPLNPSMVPFFQKILDLVNLRLVTITLGICDNQIYLLRLTPFAETILDWELYIEHVSKLMLNDINK